MSDPDPCNEIRELKAVEIIHCRGHPNVTGTHRSTFEITKDPEVSRTGTCIIGVSSDKGAKDLSDEFKKILSDERSELTAVFEVGGSHFQVRSFGSAKAVEIIHCRGHPNVTGTHRSTFEITKDPEVSRTGTCIIGVSSDKGAKDLSDEFKKILSDERSELTAVFEVGGSHFQVRSFGSAGITLEHETDLVWRRSSFTCGRTVGIYSDCTAGQIPRDIIKKIQEGTEITVVLTARLNPEARSPPVPHLFSQL